MKILYFSAFNSCLGYLACKIVSEMTNYVSGGTLKPGYFTRYFENNKPKHFSLKRFVNFMWNSFF